MHEYAFPESMSCPTCQSTGPSSTSLPSPAPLARSQVSLTWSGWKNGYFVSRTGPSSAGLPAQLPHANKPNFMLQKYAMKKQGIPCQLKTGLSSDSFPTLPLLFCSSASLERLD